jgi:dTDP-4-dehydrorhamnose 3,5-epimerase
MQPDESNSMNQAISAEPGITPVGERDGLHLAIRKRNATKTQGKIVSSPSSPDLIEGVEITALTVHSDDRGWFMELARLGSTGIARKMAAASGGQIQISTTLAYGGTIKAIHYHYQQTDLWAPISGMLQIFLYDLRRNSKSFGLINTIYAGQLQPWEILIPPGVGHGYKVLGTQPAQLVYVTDRYYDPADEGRLPYDHPDLGYDWETQRK